MAVTDQKTGLGTGAMFDSIAGRYDRMNRILSLGGDQRWRRTAARALELAPGQRVLDLACGTADMAQAIARRHPDVSVVGLDPSRGMLAIGRDKVRRMDLAARVIMGDAQQLPFSDGAFDAVTMAFGIRNVPRRAAALQEMARVTRPGGDVVILELSVPQGGLVAPLARLHIHHLVPRLGAWLAGGREYRYLQSSVEAFPPPGAFARMMDDAGITVREIRPLTFGACTLFVGAVSAR